MVAGFNLGVLMSAIYGQGTPREAAETLYALIIVLRTEAAWSSPWSPPATANPPQSSSSLQTRRETEKPGLRQRAVSTGRASGCSIVLENSIRKEQPFR